MVYESSTHGSLKNCSQSFAGHVSMNLRLTKTSAPCPTAGLPCKDRTFRTFSSCAPSARADIECKCTVSRATSAAQPDVDKQISARWCVCKSRGPVEGWKGEPRHV